MISIITNVLLLPSATQTQGQIRKTVDVLSLNHTFSNTEAKGIIGSVGQRPKVSVFDELWLRLQNQLTN